jgi:hypothetical protein
MRRQAGRTALAARKEILDSQKGRRAVVPGVRTHHDDGCSQFHSRILVATTKLTRQIPRAQTGCTQDPRPSGQTSSNLSAYVWGSQCLLANAKLTDDVPITIGIVRLQIIQQAAALAHEHKQSTPGGMVLLVRLKMLGQLTDALAQNSDLHFGASRVIIMSAKTGNYVDLLCRCQHGSPYSSNSNQVHSLSVCNQRNIARICSKIAGTGKQQGG